MHIVRYVPPSIQGLKNQKDRLGFTGEQMAKMYGLAGNSQWRKYTGGSAPRTMSLPMLFLAGALMNQSATVAEVMDWCRRETGAVIEINSQD